MVWATGEHINYLFSAQSESDTGAAVPDSKEWLFLVGQVWLAANLLLLLS